MKSVPGTVNATIFFMNVPNHSCHSLRGYSGTPGLGLGWVLDGFQASLLHNSHLNNSHF